MNPYREFSKLFECRRCGGSCHSISFFPQIPADPGGLCDPCYQMWREHWRYTRVAFTYQNGILCKEVSEGLYLSKIDHEYYDMCAKRQTL